MGKRRLLWRLFRCYLMITLVALGVLVWYAARTVGSFYVNYGAADLEAKARFLEQEALERLVSGEEGSVDSWCKELGRRLSTRITVILSSGRVIGDSEEDPARMENHGNRPEFRAAMAGQTVTSARYSRTLEQDTMYVALPIARGNTIVGVLRTSVPLASVEVTLRAIQRKILLGGLAVFVLASVAIGIASRRISRPLEKMREGAELLARGELRRVLPASDSEELGGLAEAVNILASQLDTRTRSATKQRKELEAILSSMVEGVLAVDTEQGVISLNRAAGRMLGVDPEEAQGRTVQEVTRNVDILKFIQKTLESLWPVEGEIVLHQEGERFLQAHGTILHDAEGRGIGAVIVLNDFTRIHRLENVRREFVANVVHEIRTPVTSIKGFAETLHDGALEDPKSARKFLDVIARQADRLNAIIEDLLTLSQIEQESENEVIELKEHRLIGVLRAAIQLCEREAESKGVRIELTCEDDTTARINPPLLEQAVVNLIDNAIKYSEMGSRVRLEVMCEHSDVTISVRDQGCGISEEHLPRIFERFYRVDKARSRKLGGTGLGLAIVKHIVQAHGGRVTVESALGKGSSFEIHLPRVA